MTAPPTAPAPAASVPDPAATGPSTAAPVHAGLGGTPWTLPLIAGLAAILYGVLGVQDASSIIVGFLVVVFLVFLARHMAFAASALSAAPGDMRTRTGFDFGYRPFVTVLVPCRNEELGVNDESYINQYFHYNPPITVPCDKFAFIISDKGGMIDTRHVDKDIQEIKKQIKENKDKKWDIINGKFILL